MKQKGDKSAFLCNVVAKPLENTEKKNFSPSFKLSVMSVRRKISVKCLSLFSSSRHLHQHQSLLLSKNTFHHNSILNNHYPSNHAYINHSHHPFSTTTKISNDIVQIAEGVLSGSRRDLSRAITLVESTHPSHYEQAQLLLTYIYQKKQQNPSTTNNKSFRIGITGPPGAGKSTFVNQLGSQLCESPYNKHVSVLPIDPSSFLSGGSILGDQTRMLDLFKKENAYLRPSPNRLSLGGVSDTTYEVCTLCETAGYDTIFVETVGVGQAEIEVANCVDMFILIITPTSGDDLQGLKRGIMEMADLIIVNKAEGDMINAAKHIKHDYQRALGLANTRRANIGWTPKIVLCSSLPKMIKMKDEKGGKDEGNTVLKVWEEIEVFRKTMEEKGELERCRREQSKHATWKYVWRNIKRNVKELKPDLEKIEGEVMNGDVSPREGSQEILKYIWKHPPQM